MSRASFEEDRPTENERDLRIRDLEATAIAMREALELAQREANDRLQAAISKLKKATGVDLLALKAALRARFSANAVLPTAGRAARIIKSVGCHP